MKRRMHPIAKMLKREGLRVCDLAKAAGTDWQSANRWKKGLVEPRLSTIGAVVEVLRKSGHDVHISDFFDARRAA